MKVVCKVSLLMETIRNERASEHLVKGQVAFISVVQDVVSVAVLVQELEIVLAALHIRPHNFLDHICQLW
jgi:hypothetical protein